MGDFWDTNQTPKVPRVQIPNKTSQDTPGAEPSPECFAWMMHKDLPRETLFETNLSRNLNHLRGWKMYSLPVR